MPVVINQTSTEPTPNYEASRPACGPRLCTVTKVAENERNPSDIPVCFFSLLMPDASKQWAVTHCQYSRTLDSQKQHRREPLLFGCTTDWTTHLATGQYLVAKKATWLVIDSSALRRLRWSSTCIDRPRIERPVFLLIRYIGLHETR